MQSERSAHFKSVGAAVLLLATGVGFGLIIRHGTKIGAHACDHPVHLSDSVDLANGFHHAVATGPRVVTRGQRRSAQPRSSVDAAESLEQVAGATQARDRARDRDILLKLPTWEEFYATADRPDHVIIIDRLALQFALSEHQRSELKRLIEAEQELAGKEAAAKYGGGEALEAWAKVPEQSSRESFWNDLSAIREGVRRATDSQDLALLPQQVVQVVNEHLRNERIFLTTQHKDGVKRYRITGVGTAPRALIKTEKPK